MSSKTDYPPRERAEFLCDTAGSILSVHVRGEIDHHTASSIRQGIDATLFEKRPAKLILDLSAVSFMDSSGLGLIMGRYSVMKELGGEMVVWNPSPETRAILALAGMERLVRIDYCPCHPFSFSFVPSMLHFSSLVRVTRAPPHWALRVLTTEAPGRSLDCPLLEHSFKRACNCEDGSVLVQRVSLKDWEPFL